MSKDAKSNGKQIKQLKTKNYELKNEVELLKEKSKAQEIQLDTFKKTVAGQEKLCVAMNEYLGKTSKQWIGMVKEFHIMKKIVDQMMTEGILEGRLAPTLDGQLAMVKFDYLDEKGIVQMRPEFNKKIKAFQPVKEIVPKKSTLGKQMGLVKLKKKKSTKKTTKKKSKGIPTLLSSEEKYTPLTEEEKKEKKKAIDFLIAHPKLPNQRLNVDKLKGEKKNDPKANI